MPKKIKIERPASFDDVFPSAFDPNAAVTGFWTWPWPSQVCLLLSPSFWNSRWAPGPKIQTHRVVSVCWWNLQYSSIYHSRNHSTLGTSCFLSPLSPPSCSEIHRYSNKYCWKQKWVKHPSVLESNISCLHWAHRCASPGDIILRGPCFQLPSICFWPQKANSIVPLLSIGLATIAATDGFWWMATFLSPQPSVGLAVPQQLDSLIFLAGLILVFWRELLRQLVPRLAKKKKITQAPLSQNVREASNPFRIRFSCWAPEGSESPASHALSKKQSWWHRKCPLRTFQQKWKQTYSFTFLIYPISARQCQKSAGSTL